MGRAKNTLNAADVSSTPIKVKYAVSYPSSSLSDYGIVIRSGSNIPYNVTMSLAQQGLMNNYRVIRQLYYQNYLTGSVIGSASAWDPWWQSTAAVGTNDQTVYQFPTGSDETIIIYVIPPNQFGEQVSKMSFALSASDSAYSIIDDGNGNLIDIISGNEHVGNIFYAQGLAVVTNQNYVSLNYLGTEDGNIYETEDDLDIILQ